MAPSRVSNVPWINSSSPIDINRFGLSIDECGYKIEQVAGIKAARINRRAARHIEVRDDLDAVDIDRLAFFGKLRNFPRSTLQDLR